MIKTIEPIQVNHSATSRMTISDELKRDLADWMTTNQDLVFRPPIEMTQTDDEFAVKTLVTGVGSKGGQVFVEPNRVLIKGEMFRKSGRRKFMCTTKFPRPVDPNSVNAEVMDGMLSVRAKLADTAKKPHLLLKAA